MCSWGYQAQGQLSASAACQRISICSTDVPFSAMAKTALVYRLSAAATTALRLLQMSCISDSSGHRRVSHMHSTAQVPKSGHHAVLAATALLPVIIRSCE